MNEKNQSVVQPTEAVSKQRRKVLKSAGVASVATAATAAWHKPVVDAVLTPAHAQMTTPPLTFNGSTGTSSVIVQHGNAGKAKSIAAKLADTLIPPAHADNGIGVVCNAFTDNTTDDYTHCVSISLPDGEDPNGAYTLTLDGPDIYYNDYGYYYGAYYYEGVVNFSGSGMGTLANREIDITINGIRLCGEVSEDFTGATGDLENVSGNNYRTRYNGVGNSGCDDDAGYGAYWGVSFDGGNCTIGSGASNDYPIIIGDPHSVE